MEHEIPLGGRRVLVTGAGSGMGRATARRLLAAGCRVVATDRGEPDPALAGADWQQADLARQEDVDGLFAGVHSRQGPLDALICCAGVGIHERLTEGDPAKWARLLEVNVLGLLRLIRAFVPPMLARGGDVVVVGSVAAARAYPYGGVYAASKAAVEMVAEALRLEVQPAIRVTTLAPGVVDTGFFAHMLAGQQSVEEIGFGSIDADQVAELIAYAISRPPNLALNHLVVRPRGQSF